eukprot:evm.model.scf_168.6 EVM.evm.TU.scf_168.6   scf_168:35359-38600(+)
MSHLPPEHLEHTAGSYSAHVLVKAVKANKMIHGFWRGQPLLTTALLVLALASTAFAADDDRGGTHIHLGREELKSFGVFLLACWLALRALSTTSSVLKESPTDVFENQATALEVTDMYFPIFFTAVVLVMLGPYKAEQLTLVSVSVIVEIIQIFKSAAVYNVRGVLKPLRASYGGRARHLIGSCTTLSQRAVDELINQYEEAALPDVKMLGHDLCFSAVPAVVKSEFYLKYISGLVRHIDRSLWDGAVDLMACWVKEQAPLRKSSLRVESLEVRRNYGDSWTPSQFIVRSYLLSGARVLDGRERYFGAPQVFTRSTEMGFHVPQQDAMWARRVHVEVQIKACLGTDNEAVNRLAPFIDQNILRPWIRTGTIRKPGEMRMYAQDGKIAIDPEYWNCRCQGAVAAFRHITSSAWVAGWPTFGIDTDSTFGSLFHSYTQGARLKMTAVVAFDEDVGSGEPLQMEVFRHIEDVWDHTVGRGWVEPGNTAISIAFYIYMNKVKDSLGWGVSGLLGAPSRMTHHLAPGRVGDGYDRVL